MYFSFKSLSFIFITIYLSIAFCEHLQAETYYVSPNGESAWNACSNIGTPCSWSTAMSNAVAGDIVYFRGGTYTPASCSTWEHVAIGPSNSGTPGNPITFIAYPGENPIIAPCSNDMPAFGARDVSYIIWDGFSGTISKGSGEVWFFLYWNSDYSIIRNCNFTGANHNYLGNSSPIRIEASNGNEIYNNRITGHTGETNTAGIWLFEAASCKIYQNTIINGANGIQQKTGPNSNNEIYQNFILHMSEDGIMQNEQVGGPGGNKIYQNVVAGCGTGISLYNGGGAAQRNYEIYNNTIYNCGVGIQSGDEAIDAKIWNNIIANCDTLVRYCAGGNLPDYSDYNNYFSNSSYEWYKNYDGSYTSIESWRSAMGLDANSFSSDPGFKNAGGTAATDYQRLKYKTNGRGGSYESVVGAWISDISPSQIGYIPGEESGVNTSSPKVSILFEELFDDSNLSSRDWYDNTSIVISATEHIPGSTGSVEYRFLQGASTPTSGGGIRKKFTDTEEIYISYYIKHSSSWTGSNRSYHPHEFMLLTNLNGDWDGLSDTYMTVYIEENEGRPTLAIQDSKNIDQNSITQNLVGASENRGVAGCNGDSDGHGDGDCYLYSGNYYRNGKKWVANSVYFQDTPGKYYKNDWHFIEVYFKLNTIENGKGIANGEMKYWYGGELIIDGRNVLFRTGENPSMKFNQFIIGPWIGDGSPVDQTFWVDNLTVATSRPATAVEAIEPPKNLRIIKK